MSGRLEAIKVNGQTVWVEVADVEVPESARRPKGRGTAQTAKTSAGAAARTAGLEKLEEVDIGKTLQAIITPIHAALKAAAPEEVSVELALGLKGEVGVFVAKSEGSASLKVTAKWKFAPAK